MTDLSELREKAVLPLVWEQERVGSAHMWASTPTGKYTINVYAGMPKQAFQLNHNHGPASYFDTEQEAKASAQADYAQRILSAIDPSLFERIVALEKALEPFADFGEYLEVETNGFSDTDRLELVPEESDVRIGDLFVGSFRLARSTLAGEQK